jgi:hypothetical protein
MKVLIMGQKKIKIRERGEGRIMSQLLINVIPKAIMFPLRWVLSITDKLSFEGMTAALRRRLI